MMPTMPAMRQTISGLHHRAHSIDLFAELSVKPIRRLLQGAGKISRLLPPR
jgi:hypothetical protein